MFHNKLYYWELCLYKLGIASVILDENVSVHDLIHKELVPYSILP